MNIVGSIIVDLVADQMIASKLDCMDPIVFVMGVAADSGLDQISISDGESVVHWVEEERDTVVTYSITVIKVENLQNYGVVDYVSVSLIVYESVNL